MMRMLERFWCWLAWRLPRDLVMWCAVRLMAYATTGPYDKTQPGEISIIDALNRWRA